MPTEEFYAGQVNYIPKMNALWDRATVSVIGTSTDSLSISVASKTFTTNTYLQFAEGSQVTITATADLSKYMSGQVTAYDQETGDITVNVGATNGSGTFSNWSITLSGAAGATGAAGADGIADNISIGTVTAGTAAASITGTSPNKFLNLTLQTGATGAAGAPNVLSIGTVTDGATADATITGTSPAQVLNLVLPKGDTGDTGDTGASGLTARGAWNGATAYVTTPSVDWVTYAGSSYYRKVAGATGTDPATDTTNWGLLAAKGADGAGTVTGVTASAPLASTGGANPTITITQATTSTDGYLSSANWNTFNNKQAALGYTPANKAGDNFTGNVGIGNTSVADCLRISKNITGGTTSSGVVVEGVVQSDATASAGYFTSNASTAATTFTVPFLSHFAAQQGTFGVGSTVTNQYGFTVAASLAGATNNYAFLSQLPAGANNWNLYMLSTAKNYLAGNLLIGSLTDTGEKLQVTGTASVVSNSATPALKITQTGTGNALVVEDVASDTTPFVVNNAGFVGIGTQFPAAPLDISSDGFLSSPSFRAYGVSAGAYPVIIRGRGTQLAPAAVQAGDTIGGYQFAGYDGTAPITAAIITAVVDGTPGANDMPGRLAFSTTPTGSATPVERMRINSAGNVLVGGTTDTGEKLQVTGNAKVAGTITATNVVTNGYTAGYLEIPQNSQSAAYTLVLADAGKHLLHPSADTTARTFTIPANASVAFPIGTAISFINQNGGGAITIAITSDVMRLAGAGTTGSRTLAANGIATAIKVTATEWIISGVNLT